MGTGTLEARVKTTISPRIQERLAEVLVDQDDVVKTGQLLARLDDGELKQQVEVAEATRVGGAGQPGAGQADEARALAVEKQARLDHQRVVRFGGDQDHLAGTTSTKPSRPLHVAEADVKRSQAAIVEAESQVVTAEKNLALPEGTSHLHPNSQSLRRAGDAARPRPRRRGRAGRLPAATHLHQRNLGVRLGG